MRDVQSKYVNAEHPRVRTTVCINFTHRRCYIHKHKNTSLLVRERENCHRLWCGVGERRWQGKDKFRYAKYVV